MDFNHARPTEQSQPRRGGRRDDGVRDRDRKRAKLSISVEAFHHVSAVAAVAAVGAIAELSVVAADAALVAAHHDLHLAFDIIVAADDVLAQRADLFIATLAEPAGRAATARASAVELAAADGRIFGAEFRALR